MIINIRRLKMSNAIKQIVNYAVRKIKDENLSYDDFQRAAAEIRRKAKLQKPKRGRRLPRLLSEQELNMFFRAVARHPNSENELMFRLLLATACRVEEFTRIRKRNIDFNEYRIFIEAGKGDKDRYVPFPRELALPMRQQFNFVQEYLFESLPGKPYSPRAIQMRMDKFAREAGLVDEEGKTLVHPHLFRHQTITYLLGKLTHQEVMRISGHASYDALRIYDHLALSVPFEKYQAIMAGKVI